MREACKNRQEGTLCQVEGILFCEDGLPLPKNRIVYWIGNFWVTSSSLSHFAAGKFDPGPPCYMHCIHCRHRRHCRRCMQSSWSRLSVLPCQGTSEQIWRRWSPWICYCLFVEVSVPVRTEEMAVIKMSIWTFWKFTLNFILKYVPNTQNILKTAENWNNCSFFNCC